MTVIAAYQYEESSCFVFGDGLVTSEFQPTTQVNLPSRGFRYGPAISMNGYVTALQQKVCIVNRRLVVAWAGRLPSAYNLLDDMHKNLQDESSINKTDVYRYLDVAAETGLLEDCVIVGAYLDNETDTEHLFGAIERVNRQHMLFPKLPGMRGCIVSGSGFQDFVDIKKRGLQFVREKGVPAEQIDRDVVIAQSIADITEMLFEEVSSGENLWSRYGGFYDLAWNQGEGYRKLTDVLILNVKYDVNDKTFLLGYRVIKLDVVSTTTVMRIISFPWKDENKGIEFTGFAIGSMIREQATADWELIERLQSTTPSLYGNGSIGLPDMSAAIISVVVHVTKGTDILATFPYVQFSPKRSSVIIEPDCFSLSPDFRGRIIDAALERSGKQT